MLTVETEQLLRLLEEEQSRGWTGVSQPPTEQQELLQNLIDTVRKVIQDSYKQKA